MLQILANKYVASLTIFSKTDSVTYPEHHRWILMHPSHFSAPSFSVFLKLQIATTTDRLIIRTFST